MTRRPRYLAHSIVTKRTPREVLVKHETNLMINPTHDLRGPGCKVTASVVLSIRVLMLLHGEEQMRVEA
ncbi:hypothetical protein TNCV_2131161 [Trichonephila clavipes]|nr:hypothetical protein TNCV_2131161 [Trichonephila clavipes]